MENELWIILQQDGMGHVTIAGSYNVENDPLPGLRQVLSKCEAEAMNHMVFFALCVKGHAVSLHYINPLPTFDKAEIGASGHSDAHCGGCLAGHTSRAAHICEARS